MQGLSLSIGDQTLTTSGGRLATMAFAWPGSGARQVRLTGKFGGGPDLAFATHEGLWALFRFFDEADRWQSAGNSHRLEWVLRQGRSGRPLTLPDGRPLTVRFDLEAAAPVFRKGFLAGLNCVSRVVR
jgi:type VI protein secretion system component VasK